MRVTFAEMGGGSIALAGVLSMAGLDVGIRRDEVVVGAVLHLRLSYSPSLLPELSHLRVTVNGQAASALMLTKADAGHEVERSISLDPRYFSDFNHIQLDFIGHYTIACEDPHHSSLWARISRDSDLTLTLRPLDLRDDLSLLPAPFFDQHDNRRLILPIVLPANPSRDMVRSAGVAASWFGVLADYRSARFPVSFDSLPAQHALVLATNSARPKPLSLPAVQAPTVSVVDNPANPSLKLLVFQGRDEAQLRQAVEGVVLGNDVLTGSGATVAEVAWRRRAAYDAPRWVRTDRPVRLGELIDDPGQLQRQGVAPPPVAVNVRLPPDLFTWNRAGVPVELKYRYTAPASLDNSVLTVSVNNQLLRSYRLPPESESGSGGRLLVPLLQNDGARETQGLLIPAFQLASDNRMQFQFAMDVHHEHEQTCSGGPVDNTHESIDPDSTVDVSSFPHYTALPNLALFANTGFPFTRYADLGETAIVLPDTKNPAALEQLFFVLGRFGRQTGATALAYRLIDAHEALAAQDADLLILSGQESSELLEHWDRQVALVLRKLGRDYHELARAPSVMTAQASGMDNGAAPHVLINAGGSLAAFLSFQSPVSRGRTVVALAGTDAAAAQSLVSALDDESKVPLIRGELAVVRSGTVQSYQGGGLYYVGSLSWWQWLWFHFSQHALLLTLVSLAAAVAVALFIYGLLQRLVAQRLESRSGA